MTAIAERTAVDRRFRRTWLQASKNTEWCLPGCVIGGFGTIAYFRFTGISWPTLPIMIFAIVNGLLTSIALETAILGRQMGLRTAFRTATGMSFFRLSTWM